MKKIRLIMYIMAIFLFLAGIYYIFSNQSVEGQRSDQGYKVAVVSSLYKIFRQDNRLPITDAATVRGARNEYECFQIVIYDVQRDLADWTIEVSALQGVDGSKVIPAENITVREVGYVPTSKPYYRTNYVGLWPDPLLEVSSFSLKKGERKVLWVNVFIPQHVSAGEYTGTISFISPDGSNPRIPLNLTVWDFDLPLTPSLRTAFDYYPHFMSKFYPRNRGESYEAWKRRVENIHEQAYLSMLHYKISPVLNIDPLDDDFSVRIERYLARGINAFGIGHFGGSFGNQWPASEAEVTSLYQKYAAILREKGLLQKAYIYTWDEGELHNPQVSRIAQWIHRADPELNNMVCYHGFWDIDKYPQWGKDIDIWCFGIGDYDAAMKAQLEAKGMQMWMYISGPGNGYPNFAIDFPAMDARIIPVLCWKYDIQGLLYWCVNFTRKNPFEDAMNTDWQQNGNGLLYYPGEEGVIPSLRLELIRDGIEDYDYFTLLKQRIVRLKKLIAEKAEIPIGKAVAEDLLSKGEFLLRGPEVITSMREYSENIAAYEKMRQDIAKLIVAIDALSVERHTMSLSASTLIEEFDP